MSENSTLTPLFLTPASVGAVSRLMHAFARNYTGLFNGRHGRTRTLWEGQYKACLVDSGRYFLVCSRHIEINPVRAWRVPEPGDYPRSSHGANAGYREDPLLSPHPEYLALGMDPSTRAAAYRAIVAEGVEDRLVAEIRAHLQQQKVLGSDRFQAWVTQRTGKFAGLRARGWPPASGNCP